MISRCIHVYAEKRFYFFPPNSDQRLESNKRGEKKSRVFMFWTFSPGVWGNIVWTNYCILVSNRKFYHFLVNFAHYLYMYIRWSISSSPRGSRVCVVSLRSLWMYCIYRTDPTSTATRATEYPPFKKWVLMNQ